MLAVIICILFILLGVLFIPTLILGSCAVALYGTYRLVFYTTSMIRDKVPAAQRRN